jgi:hypothetical protein
MQRGLLAGRPPPSTSDASLTGMAEARADEGDPELRELFERYNGQLVSPGGAAALLGLSRKTIYTLGQRGVINVFHASETNRWSETGRSWAFIPLEDLEAYAEKVGRPFPKLRAPSG